MTKRINITFGSLGEGTLVCGGKRFSCLGRPDMPYPMDLTVDTSNRYPVRYSSEYSSARMPWAILIWGQRGVYIHGWPGAPTLDENGGPTAGCIHLTETDAETVYRFVSGRTRVTISYPW